MKNLLKKQQGFTLIELMIVVAIIGILASIALPSYKDYMTASKWGKTIAGIRALKLAVENCLSDNGGAFDKCDALSQGKVADYGVSQYATANGEFLSIELMSNTAEIKITGDAPLSGCVLIISPSFTTQVGIVSWNYSMTHSSSAEVNKCKSFVKHSTG